MKIHTFSLKEYKKDRLASDRLVTCFEQASGAWPNGTRVSKINSDDTDAHVDGALATVFGSVEMGERIGYFVCWDDTPGIPVLIADVRLKPVTV